jgi:hypothetical protein
MFQIVGGLLRAPGGRIQIAAVSSTGEVVPGPPGEAPALGTEFFGDGARRERADYGRGLQVQAEG